MLCNWKKVNIIEAEVCPDHIHVQVEIPPKCAVSSFIGYLKGKSTIVNFWNNGCGTCIAEMPELEEMYQEFQQDNINLIGVGADSGEGEEQLELARKILAEKGVTYQNIVPNPENDFYKEFIGEIGGYPTTYVVDSEGNIIGAPLIGNVKEQMDTLQSRIELARGGKE